MIFHLLTIFPEFFRGPLDYGVVARGVDLPLTASVRVRYRHEGARATITREGERVVARFDQPVRAITRGQIAVLYDGDRVLGGGRIASALAPS